jgi:hypothetical protein
MHCKKKIMKNHKIGDLPNEFTEKNDIYFRQTLIIPITHRHRMQVHFANNNNNFGDRSPFFCFYKN